jgi:isopenicillin-N N-acyltransferase-like protein
MGRKISVSILAVVVLLWSQPAAACTLWAAAGNAVAGGGSLLAKNRDWSPNHDQELLVVKPQKGYKYIGLVVPKGQRAISPGVRGGINEKGFAVVNATAGSIAEEERYELGATHQLVEKLLTQCASVDEALKKTDLFVGPRYLMLADRHKTAVVEIGPGGRIAVQVQENGSLHHTNHYVEQSLLAANVKIGKSSKVRYERIGKLLADTPRPYTLENFIAFSQDRSAGPDNSIMRTGSTPSRTRTLAVVIFAIPPQGSPEAYIKLLNPGEEEQIFRLKIQDALDGKIALP